MDVELLRAEIDRLPPELRDKLAHGRFDPARLAAWSADVAADHDAMNRLSAVSPPLPEDIASLPAGGSAALARIEKLGEQALARREVALLVLAGGMATRMGGVVKALVEALPGKTFLDLRLGEKKHLETRFGRPFPLWLMTSEATDGPIRNALGDRAGKDDLDVFTQNVSLRLDETGALFRTDDGLPSVYPTGHGDVPDALRASGLLDAFRARGGKYVWIANLDNLGATVSDAILGFHIETVSKLTVEVVDKAGDKGGVPVRYEGRPVVCEDFRLPTSFDPSVVPVFNTNTFLVSADALATYAAPWTYCVVKKNVGGRLAIQRERLLGEITFYLPTRFLRVPRDGALSRFLPVKDPEELAKRQADIEVVARTRGLLG